MAPLILWILIAPVWAHKPSLSPGSSSLVLKPHHSPWGKAMISPSGHYLHKAHLNFHLGADILENKCSCFFKQPKSHHSSYRSLMLLSFSFWRRKKRRGKEGQSLSSWLPLHLRSTEHDSKIASWNTHTKTSPYGPPLSSFSIMSQGEESRTPVSAQAQFVLCSKISEKTYEEIQ